ncbi:MULTISPECIES: hypothetical protein [Flavobacterium]|uniref:Uncharacterized protein n=1 Tax=Flavobacterium jumunjinense TaxID=998845 RepID=A0ABV5GS40_9FLAO|nr:MULTISPECIES: hypothetical protein [Flavobacterium]
MKKILFIIITLTISQLNYSQNKIQLTEKDTLNPEIIENILDFEDIKFKNYILKNIAPKKKKTKIYYYQYFNNLEVTKGEISYVSTIKNLNKGIKNDSILNIKLFVKTLDLNKIKVQFFTNYENAKSKLENLSFQKYENEPSEIDIGFEDNKNTSEKSQMFFRIIIGYYAGRNSNDFDLINSCITSDKFKKINHTFDEDLNYFVFEFEIE